MIDTGHSDYRGSRMTSLLSDATKSVAIYGEC